MAGDRLSGNNEKPAKSAAKSRPHMTIILTERGGNSYHEFSGPSDHRLVREVVTTKLPTLTTDVTGLLASD